MYEKCKFNFIILKICPKNLLNALYVTSFMVGVAKKRKRHQALFKTIFYK
jgi:hypothetical protein